MVGHLEEKVRSKRIVREISSHTDTIRLIVNQYFKRYAIDDR